MNEIQYQDGVSLGSEDIEDIEDTDLEEIEEDEEGEIDDEDEENKNENVDDGLFRIHSLSLRLCEFG